MTEVFRTNIDTNRKADFILKKMKKAFPAYLINFDLEDCDNILRVESIEVPFDATSVIELVQGYGFQISILPDEIKSSLNKLNT